MKLPELKERTRYVWEILHSWKGEPVESTDQFVQEIRSFGDRRFKRTWIKALCRFKAMLAYESCLDAWALLAISFNFSPDRWDYELRHQILDEFLMYPDSLEIIKAGLEDLFSDDFTPQEREQINGFYSMVEERERVHRGLGLTARLAQSVAGISAAA
ncbi:MAG: hypothetical protein AAFY78_22875 [Cyanobacteria bacterium J06648_16]